ncbi:YOR304C-A [Saccharomyces arboricola H-6]|uniref:YOR304C-A n=1 Tax=Saccharomyces arboricola (strain H-6 / AS 2.3317 / CBS 10644) TaxID=1160507 RepID=J8PYX5_SACAR|nr:YOR304C-A [Saccharomyces arboricola H-6]
MSTEKLETSEELQAPLTNTYGIDSVKEDPENVVTVFDLANEIEKSLKDVQRQMKENDDEFSRSIQAIEDRLNKLSQ